MTEDAEGRAMVECTTLLPPFSSPSQSLPEMLPIEETIVEVMVAAVDIELLHRRKGHIESAALKRVGRDELVRNLEGGVVGGGSMSRL